MYVNRPSCGRCYAAGMIAVEARPVIQPVAAKPPMPREHGAWGILLLPFATATGVAGVWNLPVSLLLISILCFYLGRTSFLKQNLRWTVILLGVSALSAAPLLVVWHRWWLIAFAAVAGPLAFRKTEHNLAMQLAAVAGLTLTAPAAWYVGTGDIGWPAWRLWLLNALYFIGGVFYVKMHIGAAIRRQPLTSIRAKLSAGRVTLAYYAAATILLAVAAATGIFSYWILLAFLPAVARAIAGVALLSPTLRVKKLGWTEVAYSIIFAVALVAAIRAA